MKSLFAQIQQLTPTLHGWATVEKGICLASYTLALEAEVATEVGTWGGRSAFPILLAMKERGKGKLICIDPWNPDESAKGQGPEDKEWWKEVANHELVYQHFVYHVEKLGLQNYCEIRRMTSDDSAVPAQMDLWHSDGNHGPQAIVDTKRYAPSIRQYGICVLDDLDWNGGYVRQSEKWLLENGFVLLHSLGTGAAYMKIK